MESLKSEDASASWAELIEQNEHQAALQKIEEALHADGSDLAARLWWVLCQLELGSLPAMALTTPLEEIYKELENEPRLHAPGCEAFLRVAELLMQRGQLRLAVVMAERALALAKRAQSFGPKERNAVAAAYRLVAVRELERAEKKLEAGEYVDSLKASIEAAADEADEPARPTADEAEPEVSAGRVRKSAVFNSKSILEESLRDDQPAAGSAEPNEPAPTRRSWRPPRMLLVAGIFLLLVSALLSSNLLHVGADLADVELAMASPVSQGAPAFLPEPGRLRAVTIDSSDLDSVQDRLNQLAIGSGRSDEKPAPSLDDALQDPSVDSSLMKPAPQPKLDTAAVRPERRPSASAGESVASVDPAGVDVSRVEDLGRSGPSRLAKGRDGRLYGPAPQEARGLDGSPVTGVEVQQFSKPELYRTVTPTAVLEAPSVLSPAVERLEANAKIQVVSRMGQWLELRSSGGRRGYIFAQDAVKVE